MEKTRPRARKRDDVAKVVAEIHGVTPQYVNMVRNGDRDNEEIMNTCVEYELGKSRLIQALEKLVPITPQPTRYARKKNKVREVQS